jgi:glutamyl-Q tRNA(Asp) synthetase
MEDIDAPRNLAGAADDILRTLERFGFTWDGPVLYQSSRLDAYEAALDSLRGRGLVFPCGCSRKDLVDGRYNGVCRSGLTRGRSSVAWRLRVDGTPIRFEDRWQGPQSQNVEEAIGDFVLRRAGGLFTYQFAVVVDDAAQEITDIVRGADLLDSTPRQIYLQRALGAHTPRYLHVPVAVNETGQKLSKQTGARPLNSLIAATQLSDAFAYLGMSPHNALRTAYVADVWKWALSGNWLFYSRRSPP